MISFKSKLGYIVLIAMFFSVCAGKLWAQSVRSKMAVSPEDVYFSVFDLIEEDEYEKMNSSILDLKPILGIIKNRFGLDLETDIKAAIKEKENERISEEFIRLIFYDMIDMLKSIETGKAATDTLREWLKMAYANYIYLAPVVISEKKAFRTNQMIKKEFNRANGLLRSETPYSEEELEINTAQLQKVVGFIVKFCVSVFPEYDIEKVEN